MSRAEVLVDSLRPFASSKASFVMQGLVMFVCLRRGPCF